MSTNRPVFLHTTHAMWAGVKSDVKLIRTGPGELMVDAAVSTDSLSVRKLSVNGKKVGGGDTEQMFEGGPFIYAPPPRARLYA